MDPVYGSEGVWSSVLMVKFSLKLREKITLICFESYFILSSSRNFT